MAKEKENNWNEEKKNLRLEVAEYKKKAQKAERGG